jgi:hypothetical protein
LLIQLLHLLTAASGDASQTSGDVRLESAKWAKAGFHQAYCGVVSSDCCEASPPRKTLSESSAASPPKLGHCLHELIVRDIAEYARRCWRIDGEAAKLPIQADRAQAGSSDRGVARNVVDLELARIDVTQREIGVTSCVDRGDARELPIQPNRV